MILLGEKFVFCSNLCPSLCCKTLGFSIGRKKEKKKTGARDPIEGWFKNSYAVIF